MRKKIFYFSSFYCSSSLSGNREPVKAVDHKICVDNQPTFRSQLLGREIGLKEKSRLEKNVQIFRNELEVNKGKAGRRNLPYGLASSGRSRAS